MSDDLGPPPVKRMRYNLRSSARLPSNDATNNSRGSNEAVTSTSRTQSSHHCTYQLRSRGQIDANEVQTLKLPRKRKKSSLLTLNADCLLTLFGYLSPVDLCSMAETCTALFNYAKYHFRLNHRNFDFASMFDGDLLDVNKATKLLSIFGDQIQVLKCSRDFFKDAQQSNLAFDDVSTELLQSIANNCQQIVKELALDGIHFIHNIMVDRMLALFNSLETLRLDQCTMYDVVWCDMKNLKTLKLTEVDGFEPYFWRAKFDQLETVEFNHLDINAENLTEFLLAVPTIKRLSIVKCENIATTIFGAIKLLEHLEEFEFQLNRPNRSEEFHHRDLMYLLELKKLKVLKLYCSRKSVRQLIDGICEKNIALEQLELAHGLVDVATVEAIAKLKTIKVLKLNNMIEFVDYLLSPIANGMSQLEEFHIKTEAIITQFRIKEIVRSANRLACLKIDAKDFSLKLDTYNAILGAVKNRNDQIRLAVTIYSDGNQATLPENVLHGPNEKWLSVNTLDRNANFLFQLYAWATDETDSDDEFDEFDDDDGLIFLDQELLDDEFDSDENLELSDED